MLNVDNNSLIVEHRESRPPIIPGAVKVVAVVVGVFVLLAGLSLLAASQGGFGLGAQTFVRFLLGNVIFQVAASSAVSVSLLGFIVYSVYKYRHVISPPEESPEIIPSVDSSNGGIEQATPLLEGITDGERAVEILEAVRDIPSAQWADVIEYAIPLLKGITDGERAVEILEAVRDIPSAQWADFIKQAAPLLKVVTTRATPRLLKGATKESYISKILEAVINIPSDQRAGFIEQVTHLLKGVTNGYYIARILKAVVAIPSDQRACVIEQVTPLLEGRTDGYYIARILKAMRDTPSAQRADVIERATPLLKGITDGYDIADILKAVRDTPSAQRVDVTERATPLVAGITDGIGFILGEVRDIPSAKWADFIEQATPLLEGITDGIGIAYILRAVKNIPSDQRADVIKHATPLLEGVIDGCLIAKILKAVVDIPFGQRADFIEQVTHLLEGVTDVSYISKILEAVINIPSDQRADFIEQVTPLLKGVTKGKHIANILYVVEGITSGQRADVIKHATPLLEGITDKNQICDILWAVFFFSPDDREDSSCKIKAEMDRGKLAADASSLLEFVFVDEKIRINSLIFLETTLNTLVDLNQAYIWANSVVNQSEVLRLHEEHSLMQTAIEVISASEPSTDPKNPYVLFKTLKEFAEKKSLFSPPEYVIDGQHVIFQPEKFRESAVVSVPRKELPEVKADALQQLVSDLDKRLAALPKNEEDKALEYIREMTSLSLDGLKIGSLNSAELHGRLSSTADPVDLYTAQLLCIVKYIQDQPNELREGNLLTPREELLVKTAISIQMCPTGKKEGIYGYYHTFLPKEYKLKGVRQPEEGETVEIARVKECIATVIEKKLAEQFSGTNKLMEQLVGTDKIEQGVHQALYLKNLIGQFVGLSHSLTFDRNSGVLYDSLVAMSREEVLGTFYEHFTPELLTDALQKQVNASLTETMELFNDIDYWLPEGVVKTIWDLDEDTSKPTLNEHGAVELLKLAGYLTETPA